MKVYSVYSGRVALKSRCVAEITKNDRFVRLTTCILLKSFWYESFFVKLMHLKELLNDFSAVH